LIGGLRNGESTAAALAGRCFFVCVAYSNKERPCSNCGTAGNIAKGLAAGIAK